MRTRRVFRWFRRTVLQAGGRECRSGTELARAGADVVMLGRFYYLFLAFSTGTFFFQFDVAYQNRPPTAPLWPIEWLERLIGSGWYAYGRFWTAGGLIIAIAAAAFPRTLLWRIGSFAYLLIHVSLANSYGAINHDSHVVLFVAFALLFLPGRDESQCMTRKSAVKCLNVLWFVQGLILLSYTLAGIWKLWHSRLGVFSLDAMSKILLDRAFQEADNIPALLPFVVQHNWLAQSMYWLTLYIEVFALLVIFRPHLHRLFGGVFILFHITSDWLMGIGFSLSIMMLGLFLLLSPLAPARFSLSGVIRSLPVVGIPFRILERRQRSQQPQHVSRLWLVYDGECPMCSNYAQLLRLRESVGEFRLVDARAVEGSVDLDPVDAAVIEEVRSLPHDLNDGMVAKLDGRLYVGHEALRVLALLSEDRGAFNKFNRLAFSSPLVARLFYPLMKAGRWVLLKIKGVKPIPAPSESASSESASATPR